MLSRVGTLILIGIAIGTGLTIWATKFVGTLLFQLEARDPATIAVAIGTLTVVGLVAGWLPARRAAGIEPTVVLRQ